MNDFHSNFDKRVEFGNFEANLRFLNETGTINKTKKILEIGSGLGGLLNFLIEKGHDITGIEINEEKIKKSKILYGDLPLYLSTSELLPFADRSFDIVMSFDVFEHIKNSDRHLSEVSRVLKDNGYYLLQTPNKYANVIFECLRWKSFKKWRDDHCSLHSYREIVDRFTKNGFDIKFYEIRIVDEFYKRKIKRHLGGLGLFMLKIINPDRLPLIFKTNFFIMAKKK